MLGEKAANMFSKNPQFALSSIDNWAKRASGKNIRSPYRQGTGSESFQRR